ncbi:GerW family sporulation protein [uncultured Methanomethylovorans sp.]|uniref:GerW family sporulation protein n=1 Tax=uncultured Methanomethylovorans sp. TaxID=183759 RepID=UPI002AA677E4|nr:GerW family sporulation protein [uncultured Methanomethylovorans sp.]
MGLEDLMKEVSSELERLVSTKTVVGDAVTVGDTTIIPVTKVSFGFGTGGAEGKSKDNEEGFGGGGAAGAKIEPVAFIVMSKDGVRLMSVSGKSDIGVLIDSVPGLIEKIKTMKAKKEKSTDSTDPVTVPEDEGSVKIDVEGQ